MVQLNIRQSEHLQAEKLFLPDFVYDNAKNYADFVINNKDLQSENCLWTAVTILLFTDARADESTPLSKEDPKGWVGDAIDGDVSLGSQLWTLERSYIKADTINQIQKYASEALNVLVAQEAINSYIVNVTQVNTNKVNMDITLIANYSLERYNQKFELVWGQIYDL